MTRLCRLVALALLAGVLAPAESRANPTDPVRGQERYLAVCARCHDVDPLKDRPRQVIGVPGGVRAALEAIAPMRGLQSELSARDIIDIQAFLDSRVPGYIADTRALSGAWFDPASSGQGFSLSVLAGDRFAFLFHGHRDDGSNLTLAGSTLHRPRFGQAFSLSVVAVEGGRFTGLDPGLIRRPLWGQLSLRFLDCRRAEAVLDGRDGRQTLLLQALTPIEGLSCDSSLVE